MDSYGLEWTRMDLMDRNPALGQSRLQPLDGGAEIYNGA
jgi:hypothetical protein